MRTYLSEFVGTFILVFFGTGSIMVDAYTGGLLGHMGICVVFGLIVLVLIYTIGDISGAHLNPAITFGFYLSKLLPLKDTLMYILFQFAGAIAGSFLLKYLTLDVGVLGETIPKVTDFRAFLLESMITFVLMFVVVNLSYGSKQKGITSGIAVGSTIVFTVLIAGPLTGGSMNPARSLGPALASMHFTSLWVYLTAPFFGSGLAVALYSYIFASDARNNRDNLMKILPQDETHK